LFKFKEDTNFNRRNTLSISRSNPPKFVGGLKFESEVEIGKKVVFFRGFVSPLNKGLIYILGDVAI